MKTHVCHFNGHFPDKPGPASCLLDSQPPVILTLVSAQGRPKQFRPTGTWAAMPSRHISCHDNNPRGKAERYIMGRTPTEALPAIQPNSIKALKVTNIGGSR